MPSKNKWIYLKSLSSHWILKKTNPRRGSKSWFSGKASLTLDLRHAKAAIKSTTRRKTSIGVVGCIRVNMEAKCGGAVANRAENSLAADSVSTSRRMMRMTIWRMSRINTRIRARNMCVAHVAKKLVTRSKNAPETPTSKLEWRLRMNLSAFKRWRTSENCSLTQSCKLRTCSKSQSWSPLSMTKKISL